jgi:hypothetical protein
MPLRKLSAIIILIALPLALIGWMIVRARSTGVSSDAQPHQIAAQPAPVPSPLPASAFSPKPHETTGNYMARQTSLANDPVKKQQVLDAEIAELERQHKAEPIDAAWKLRSESGMTAIATSQDLKASGIAPTSYSNDCRSRTCRIAASFKSSGDAEDWAMMLTTMSGSTLRQTRHMVINNPDGTFELRVYGARK